MNSFSLPSRHKRFGFLLSLFALFCFGHFAFAKTKIITAHPLLADCAERVGGEFVEVEYLGSQDVHNFSPTASQLTQLAQADIILVLGKGLEDRWLGDLQKQLKEGQKIIQLGDAVPDLSLQGKHLAVCPHCGSQHGLVDPHWWHSVGNWERAAKHLGKELGKMEPANKKAYTANAKTLAKELEEVKKKYTRAFTKIPKEQRFLPVHHAAFGYLCAEFKLKQIPLLGLTGSGELSAKHLQDCVNLIEENGVTALFTEEGTSTKGIDQLSKSTGVAVAGSLLADGDERERVGVIEFFEHNLSTIAKGLVPQE